MTDEPRRFDIRDWQAVLKRYNLPLDLFDVEDPEPSPPRQLLLFDDEDPLPSSIKARSRSR